jgi:hypothetical protein
MMDGYGGRRISRGKAKEIRRKTISRNVNVLL